MHKFERQGLGKPPYRFTGVEVKVGPIIVSQERGVTMSVGAPGQPMGVCQYCGNGIKYCYWFIPSEGKPFYVGSECALKAAKDSGDTCIDRAIRKELAKEKKARELDRIEEAQELVKDPEIRSQLEEVKLPTPWGGEQSFVDQFEWYMKHAGTAGRMKMVRKLDKIRKEIGHEAG